jgi:hypothetical protein
VHESKQLDAYSKAKKEGCESTILLFFGALVVTRAGVCGFGRQLTLIGSIIWAITGDCDALLTK